MRKKNIFKKIKLRKQNKPKKSYQNLKQFSATFVDLLFVLLCWCDSLAFRLKLRLRDVGRAAKKKSRKWSKMVLSGITRKIWTWRSQQPHNSQYSNQNNIQTSKFSKNVKYWTLYCLCKCLLVLLSALLFAIFWQRCFEQCKKGFWRLVIKH